MAARVARSFRGRNLVVDNSAFRRGGHEIARDEWLQALRDGRLYRTPILELEVLYSARNAREYAERRGELEARSHPTRCARVGWRHPGARAVQGRSSPRST